MRKNVRQGLCFLMAFCLLLGMLPGSARGVDAPSISPGETVEVFIDGESGSAFLTFTPERSGLYTLSSSGGKDTCCALYGSGEEWLCDNDDGGEHYNFALRAWLTAGVTYCYEMFIWGETTGSIPVTMEETPATGILSVGEAFAQTVEDGSVTVLTLTPDRTETYAIRCSGADHCSVSVYGDSAIASEGSEGGYSLTAGETYALVIECYMYWESTAELEILAEVCHGYDAAVEVDKTCDTEGTVRYTCRHCGETYSETIPAGHEYNDYGRCSLCGLLLRAEGTCGEGLSWTLEGNTLTISGQGAMDDYSGGTKAPWEEYAEHIRSVVIADGVRSIGESAFYGGMWLEEISLGGDVKTVGAYALAYTDIAELVVPASVEEIGEYAFMGCDELRTIRFEGDAPQMAESTFTFASELVARYPHGNSTWTEDVMQHYGAFDLRWEVEHLYGPWEESKAPTAESYGEERRSCTVCGYSETCEIPSGSCGEGVIWALRHGVLTVSGSGEMTEDFFGNGDIVEVIVEDGVTALSENAFRECRYLTKISLPRSLTQIAAGAFENCTALTEAAIPEGVTVIGEDAFSGCTALKEVSLPYTLKTVESGAFSLCGLSAVVLPGQLNYIGSSAFAWCSDLQTVWVWGEQPAYVYTENAFDGCSLAVCCYNRACDGWEENRMGIPLQGVSYEIGGTATCTAGGTLTVSCGEREFSVTYRPDALGHRYGERSVHQAPTTAKTGQWVRNCESCGASVYEVIPARVEAEQTPLSEFGSNTQSYDYYWSDTVDNYLLRNEDGSFTRVSTLESDYVRIEQYDRDFVYQSTVGVEKELLTCGGYYTDGTYHYLVFGQGNEAEDDKTEVVRVVVYDRNWYRIGSASLFGGNVVAPFYAGSARMELAGGILYLHTGRLMYCTADGLRHQSNITLSVPRAELLEGGNGHALEYHDDTYVSHSFNQFVKADGDMLYFVDHGDAYPRSVVIQRSILSGDGYGHRRYDDDGYRSSLDVLNIVGEDGENYTGVTVGGFEISESSLLVAGASVDQSMGYGVDKQYNIFLTVTPKDSFCEESTRTLWLTNYEAGKRSVSVFNPHLVEIDEDRYCILWTEQIDYGTMTLCYAFLNGEGEVQGEIYRTAGELSECVPVVSGGKLVWLVANYECGPDFYVIDLDDPTQITCIRGHAYTRVVTEPTCTEGGYTTCTCACGESYVGYYVDALGHDYVSSVVEVTCTQQGYTEHICRTCGHSYHSDYVEITCPSYKFRDVDRASWYHPYVDFMLERGLMNGTGGDTFAPTTNITRASVAVMLWNLAGQPEYSVTENPFHDVPDTWYTNAVLWAYEKGIVAGNGAGGFNPNNNVTRQEITVMLYKYAQAMGCELTAVKDVELSFFADGDTVASWASTYIKWAVDLGLISGRTNGGLNYLAPTGTASRAELAVIFTNFVRLMESN